jgi:ABC-2 type transport system ATP-binding protein
MLSEDRLIVFENVSKMYGEVLGVNRVSLAIEPGVTSLVGPNGAGKTTLMNLMTGLLRPTKGTVRVLGIPPSDPERFYRNIGYCSQFDAFPKGLTGFQMVRSMMDLHGLSPSESEERTRSVLERVGMTDAANRRVAGYSKGMRQRIRLALALGHDPKVLVLDEPLNGLDPMARAEAIDLFRKFAESGMHVLISSHIMHEVDIVSDCVIMMSGGYVVAEGDIQGVRHEMEDHPIQILIRCDRPAVIASRVFQQDSAVEARIHSDGRGLLVSTRNPDKFYELLNRIVLEQHITVETVAPADENVNAVYQYLVGSNGVTAL